MTSISQGVLRGESAASVQIRRAQRSTGCYPDVVRTVLAHALYGRVVTVFHTDDQPHITGSFEPALAERLVQHAPAGRHRASEVEIGIGPASGPELVERHDLTPFTEHAEQLAERLSQESLNAGPTCSRSFQRMARCLEARWLTGDEKPLV